MTECFEKSFPVQPPPCGNNGMRRNFHVRAGAACRPQSESVSGYEKAWNPNPVERLDSSERRQCPDCGEHALSDADGVTQCTNCGYSEEDEWGSQ
jgi:ribosomal protein S27AE